MPPLFALVSLLVKAGGGGSSPPQDAQESTLSGELPQVLQGLQQPRAIMKVKSTLIMCLCSACHPAVSYLQAGPVA